ncbi:hypothetical protein BJF78_28755 [Pseudonocardia sp. CNS-139]|nr:hypothetical protein BJF78_28755 [Pseudonocardia sp. CNS-139]
MIRDEHAASDVPRRPMSGQEIDDLLAALDVTAAELIADAESAEREHDRWHDEHERMVERRLPHNAADPRRSLVDQRERVTCETARALCEACRRWLVWWADAATSAVLCTARGTPVDPARLALADPGGICDAEVIEELLGSSEMDRMLIGLTARMQPGPGLDGRYVDAARLAQEEAARRGFRIRHDADGEVTVVVDEVSAESRRRRLWGDFWIEHRLPVLPTAADLVELLGPCGAPEPTVEAVRAAAAAVDGLVAAELRLCELEATDRGLADVAETDRCISELDRTFEVLAGYARTLTRALPAVRAAAAANS